MNRYDFRRVEVADNWRSTWHYVIRDLHRCVDICWITSADTAEKVVAALNAKEAARG